MRNTLFSSDTPIQPDAPEPVAWVACEVCSDEFVVEEICECSECGAFLCSGCRGEHETDCEGNE